MKFPDWSELFTVCPECDSKELETNFDYFLSEEGEPSWKDWIHCKSCDWILHDHRVEDYLEENNK